MYVEMGSLMMTIVDSLFCQIVRRQPIGNSQCVSAKRSRSAMETGYAV